MMSAPRRGSADDEHFVRDRVHHRAERAAGDGETPEHHHEQDDEADRGEHGYSRVSSAPGLTEIR